MIGTPKATRPARSERTQVQARDERGSTRSRVDTSPRRRAISPRRSLAAIRAGESGRNERSIAVALLSNLVVAAAKLAAGLTTGSAALLAEAAHSAADSVNEVLLGVSLRHGRRPADARHPLGHGGARFLWAFVAAISSFLIGGGVSIALAIRELLAGAAVERYLVAWIVLAVAFSADGISLLQGLTQARREAAQWGESTTSFLRHTSDPTLRAIVVEDIAALLIGLLLAATAFGLASTLADLLIGRSMPPARLARVHTILERSPSIDEILSVQAVYGAPQEVIVAAKVHPAPGRTADELASALDDIDRALRRELPEIAEVFIDLTSHRASPREGG